MDLSLHKFKKIEDIKTGKRKAYSEVEFLDVLENQGL